MQFKLGGKFHLKLNIGGRPIANKYCEGKMKRTLKRGLKDLKSLRRKRIKSIICLGTSVFGAQLSEWSHFGACSCTLCLLRVPLIKCMVSYLIGKKALVC